MCSTLLLALIVLVAAAVRLNLLPAVPWSSAKLMRSACLILGTRTANTHGFVSFAGGPARALPRVHGVVRIHPPARRSPRQGTVRYGTVQYGTVCTIPFIFVGGYVCVIDSLIFDS